MPPTPTSPTVYLPNAGGYLITPAYINNAGQAFLDANLRIRVPESAVVYVNKGYYLMQGGSGVPTNKPTNNIKDGSANVSGGNNNNSNTVIVIQQRLNDLGYKGENGQSIAVNGVFDSNTFHAVNAFKDSNIPGGNKGENRGVVGTTTLNLLFSSAAKGNNIVPASGGPPSLTGIREFPVVNGYVIFPDGFREKAYTVAEITALAENSSNPWWQWVTADLYQAKMALDKAVAAEGYTITYNSAFRSEAYQAHFKEIVNKLNDTTLSSAEKAIWEAEAKKHGLTKTTPVATTSAHTAGTGFDATIRDGDGKALNTKKWKDPVADDLADAAGLKLNVKDDWIHFNLK
jgi:peptidoglycan hydrolase-like protein with peptidoglycan-binding domain